MINKTVGFICPVDKEFDINDIYSKGLGGSESWIINMAMQFSDNGYHVIIFNNNEFSMNYEENSGIEILPLWYLNKVSKYQYFEHLFFNRLITIDTINILKENNNCKNIYCIVHDIHLWKNNIFFINDPNSTLNNDDIIENKYLQEHLRKIFFMSDWHVSINKQLCKYDDSLIDIIGNGINIPDSIDFNNRDNNILWSSCKERGLQLFIDKILPRIVKKIPDFKLYISSYSALPDVKSDYQDHIKILGLLNKTDLYNEMKKHKVSFLPLQHWETFCITSIENVVNGVIFISPYKFGLKTIFKYFEPLFIKDGNYDDDNYCDYVVNEIIYKINNYDQYINIQKILYSYIKDNYSCQKIFNNLLDKIKVYETSNSYYL